MKVLSRDFPMPEYQISIVHGKMKPADKDLRNATFCKRANPNYGSNNCY